MLPTGNENIGKKAKYCDYYIHALYNIGLS